MSSCQTADRWNMGIAKGRGDIDAASGFKDYDLDETTLEVGISGPLGFAPSPLKTDPPPYYYPEIPADEPDDEGLPVSELMYLVVGAGMLGGGQYARTKYRQRRSA